MKTATMKTAAEIRHEFMTFFEEKGHRIVPSAPVVPADDPTLLFTNAGMNQFKDVFLGTGSREYTRCADTQKCIRVSGKHNDLEEVGVDTYHHTFFEMLGNWSFGDYFKREAIAWAWELLVDRFGLNPELMYATVFGGDEKLGLPVDDEAEKLWLELTPLPAERVMRCGRKDNFWEMGETGPCGPCSEIHYDLGPDACDRKGVEGHVCGVNGDCGRFIEIWNLVFIQFNNKGGGVLDSLPARHVDTGMGLERLVAVLQGKSSNYDTDLFQPVLQAIGALSGHTYGEDERLDTAMRVVADHARALCASLADGALPGKQGRGYVLRRLLRRAARFGHQVLGVREPFIYKLVPVVAELFDGVFPEIAIRKPHIEHVILDEERSFARTIDTGIARFDKLAKELAERGTTVVPGEDAYRLYHQDGFPQDLIELMAREQGLTLDEKGWADAETAHKEASKGAGGGERIDVNELEGLPATEFLGYWERDEAADSGTRVEGLKIVKLVGTEALVLDRSPFYAESGGQVGDTGVVEADGFRFQVEDTGKVGDVWVHFGQLVEGDLTNLPVTVSATVALERRRDIMANHTATHLLHWALKEVLGEHANQQGSLVAPEYLRFDFTHPRSLTFEQMDRIERLVNARIIENRPLVMHEQSLEEARERGVTALFGEKYGDVVRSVAIGDFSEELCAGTHCRATGDIGYFRISSEGSVQAGVRRIFAETRMTAVESNLSLRTAMTSLARRLGVGPADLEQRVEALQQQVKDLKKRGQAAAVQDVAGMRKSLLAEAEVLGESEARALLIVARVDVPDRKALGELADAIRGGDDIVVGALAAHLDGKTALLAFASKPLVKAKKVSAGNVVKEVAAAIGQRGGGRPDFAQTGWKGDEGIDVALEKARDLYRAALA